MDFISPVLSEERLNIFPRLVMIISEIYTFHLTILRRIAPKQLDREGREVSSNKGYKYFGAAKDLPGVRELFKKSDEAEVDFFTLWNICCILFK